MVVLVVNDSDKIVSAQAHFDAAANGNRASLVRAQRRTGDGSKTDWQNWPTSFGRSMVFPPRQAEAWELRW